jgi:hypothetical protein
MMLSGSAFCTAASEIRFSYRQSKYQSFANNGTRERCPHRYPQQPKFLRDPQSPLWLNS